MSLLPELKAGSSVKLINKNSFLDNNFYLNFSSLKQDPQQRLAANELKEIIEVIFVLTFVLSNLHIFFDNLLT